MSQTSCSTPLGRLLLVEQGGALTSLRFDKDGPVGPDHDSPLLREAKTQIADYFAGRRRVFSLPLAPSGTPFQRRLWDALLEIPYGETRSYGDIAHRIDSGPRAIGGACGRNPLALVIPCHRVVAAGGKLGGYSGADGVATKSWLLRFESCFT